MISKLALKQFLNAGAVIEHGRITFYCGTVDDRDNAVSKISSWGYRPASRCINRSADQKWMVFVEGELVTNEN